MGWDYRVIEFVDPDSGPWFAIHEVFYDDAGIPNSYTEAPARVVSCDDGGNDKPLVWVIDRMREALDKPVLRETDFNPSV